MREDSKIKMLEVLRDMNVTVTKDLTQNPSTVTGIFLKEHGIEPDFLLENILLIQTINENKNILAKVTALCFH